MLLFFCICDGLDLNISSRNISFHVATGADCKFLFLAEKGEDVPKLKMIIVLFITYVSATLSVLMQYSSSFATVLYAPNTPKAQS